MLYPVFVYGSLKRRHGNHYSFLSDAKFCGEYVTKDKKYSMFSFGGFPGVYVCDECEEKWSIAGEVYLVDDFQLNRLDMLEGNGNFYTRELVDIDGYPDKCWMYLLPARKETFVDKCIIVDEGESVLCWNKAS